MMKQIPFTQTSVFVDDRYGFSGNQLATFWDKKANESLSKEDMQGIALEMNFSESTFLFESELEDCSTKVRIFTPGNELDFAGHPTIGTAYVLKYKGITSSEVKQETLELGIGPIKVEYYEDQTIGMIQSKPQFLNKYTNKEMIAKILAIDVEDISSKFPMQFVSTGFPFLIVPLESMESITKISLDAQLLLSSLADLLTSQLLVFTDDTIHDDSDIHVRMFAPSVGVLEDPATGSAAGPLGAYLEHYNVIEKHEKGSFYHFEQGFEIKRPSHLNVKCLMIEDIIDKVLVSGKTKVTAEGVFYI
ncbi:MAG: PhzF family phenazine biosynthesis protein [Candidatus Heimdallarchaeota archaeon]